MEKKPPRTPERKRGIEQVLQQAVQLHRLGRLDQAEHHYKAILAAQPSHFDAQHLLGVLRSQQGRNHEAIDNFRAALATNPNSSAALSNLGLALAKLGRYLEALASYDKALSIKPNDAEALTNRGNTLRDLKRAQEALASYDNALSIKPDYAAALNNRGHALRDLKRPEEALASYDKALAIKPDSAEVLNNRGNALSDLKRPAEALVSYDMALAIRRDYAKALNNRGKALLDLKRPTDAMASCEKALAIKPDYADAFINRGNALKELKRFDEALASYDKALAFKPDYAEAFYNRGNALQEVKRLDEALASYDKALALKRDYAEAHLNEALLRLLTGDFSRGWAQYEWRWNTKERPAFATFPSWRGEPLDGRRILIFSEQGLGDVIQFARYLPLLAGDRCQLTFLTSAKLIRLLRPLTSRIEVLSDLASGRVFDVQCALMSLPHCLGTDITSIPNAVPYLRAENDLIKRWRERIGEHGFKVGIAWQGNPRGRIDQGRSIPLKEYLALAQIPGVRLISLQKTHGLEQLAEVPKDVRIETLGEDFDNGPDAFVDTAAVISCLDLVITSDTSIPHLAGALGCRTWIALQYVPDWRWMLDRADSPWYPTARLFRQSNPDEWAPVFANIADELRSLMTPVAT